MSTNEQNSSSSQATHPYMETCSICLMKIIIPVRLSCGHELCGLCLIRIVGTLETPSETQKCPYCRNPLINGFVLDEQKLLINLNSLGPKNTEEYEKLHYFLEKSVEMAQTLRNLRFSV